MSSLKPEKNYSLKTTKELGIEKPCDLDRYLGEYYTLSVIVDEEGALVLKLEPKYLKYPEIKAYDIYSVLSKFRKLIGDVNSMQLSLLKEKENF